MIIELHNDHGTRAPGIYALCVVKGEKSWWSQDHWMTLNEAWRAFIPHDFGVQIVDKTKDCDLCLRGEKSNVS